MSDVIVPIMPDPTMPTAHSVVNYLESGDVFTEVSAWIDKIRSTGSTAMLCVKTIVYSTTEGVSGRGIVGQSSYSGNNDELTGDAVSGVLNYDEIAVDTTSEWVVDKTHDGWTAICTAKSYGEVVSDFAAYELENEVSVTIDIPSTTSYSVSYNANGGENAPESQIKWHDEVLILSGDKPTKDGHTFLGWSMAADSNEVAYVDGASYVNDADLVLYAVWEIHTWTVRYEANGGIGAPENQTKVYNEALTLSSSEPTKTGNTFKGWSTSIDGEIEYQSGDEYTDNEDMTLYAVWGITIYTLSYNANGGYNAPKNQTKEHGQTANISSVAPSMVGYKFLGWSTSTSGEVEYKADDTYTEDADIVLYAVWEKIPIMRMLNGHEICDEVARNQINGVTTTGAGEAYSAVVAGISELKVGVGFTMIPHVTSTSISPTLNVNDLGEKQIRKRLSSNSASTVEGDAESWLAEGKPVRVLYDGDFWIVDMTVQDATNLHGIVPISSGGTGASTSVDALHNLGIYWGYDEAPATGVPNTIYIQIN